MLQFIDRPSGTYSLAEQAQMAIEGGCTWVVLDLPEDADLEELRPDIADATEVAREAGVILTLADRPELAKELGIFGVLMTTDRISPAALREQLGPEAIIGYPLKSVAGAKLLQHNDIDYGVMLDPTTDARQMIADAREAGVPVPVVALGDFKLEQLPDLMLYGFNGVATGKYIVEAPDPVAATAEYIKQLTANH